MSTTQFKLSYEKIGQFHDHSVTALIVAAGSSSRMGGQDKMLAHLNGKPVLYHTINVFQKNDSVAKIVVVGSKSNLLEVQNICTAFPKVSDVVEGGQNRAESVSNGFSFVRTKYILIQDGARPLVTEEVINRVMAGLENSGACAAAVPVRDTIKMVDEDSIIHATLKRDSLMAMQTPQGFLSSVYEHALNNHKDLSGFTDDCALVESSGVKVHCVQGDYRNIKITTEEDLIVAAALMKGES